MSNDSTSRTRRKGKAAISTFKTHSQIQENDDSAAAKNHGSSFEMVVLGSGGGPLETDCSGYLLKGLEDDWEDGFLALEGGSGIGALTNILTHRPASSLFPSICFAPGYNSPLLKAAYVFSFLTCYLITHAHLDHTNSLIMLSGSVPPRATRYPQPPLSTPPSAEKIDSDDPPSSLPRPPVYGTRQTLEKLAVAYAGGLWPELCSWAPERDGEVENGRKKRRRANKQRTDYEPDEYKENGPGVTLTPLQVSRVHRPLHPTLPITILTYPVVHGCTSRHIYESSAMFIRYDPRAVSTSRQSSETVGGANEFLFFGDVECSWRREGEGGIHEDRAGKSAEMNREIWKRAAQTWREGQLSAIFIECSYDSSRPAELMFGHLSPPGLYSELKTLASLVSSDPHPLDGLRVYVIHIKEYLQPHSSGNTAREIIMRELNELEDEGRLGVRFIEARQGDRIVI